MTLTFDLFSPKLGHVTRRRDEYMCLFGSLWTSSYLKYEAIIFIFSCLVVRKPALPWQPFYASLVGEGRPHFSPEYEVDVTTRNEVMESFTCIHYMSV